MRDSETAPRARHSQSLKVQSNRSYRDRVGVFYIEGVRSFVHAVDHGFQVIEILCSDRLLINPVARKLVRRLRRDGVKTTNLSPEQFRDISQQKRASGVAALVKQRWHALEDIRPDEGFWTVLETVRSPGNLGTLIRSSAASGGAGFIFVGNSIDPYAPSVLRSAMGASFRQRFIRSDWQSLRGWLGKQEAQVIGASPDGAAQLYDIGKIDRPPFLVLGEERRGLNPDQNALCTTRVRIPMEPGSDSLNLGVAGSLLMYEIRRQREGP